MRQLKALFRRFGADESGVFAVIFAVLAIVLVATAGAVVDFTTVQQARTRAQDALDSAALGLQRTIYEDNVTEETIKVRAEALLIERLADANVTATVTNATIVKEDGMLRLSARLDIPMSFVSLVGVEQMSAAVVSEARRGAVNLEVAVALDVTLSMAGSRIQALRTATAELIDAVVQDSQSPTYSKMALIPYSSAVNVDTYAAAVRGPVRGYTNINSVAWLTPSWTRTISAINKAMPGRITTTANHGLSTGDAVYISNISGGGFTNLNGKVFNVTVLNNTQFTLNGQSTSGYSGTYSANSGRVNKCLTNECEVVVTSNGHGLSTNEFVWITGVHNSVNEKLSPPFTATDVTANTFVLENSQGQNLGSYGSGGRAYCGSPGCEYQIFQSASGGNNYKRFRITNCVTERVGANQYTDAAPSTTYVGRHYPPSSSDCLTDKIVPLTDVKSTLKSAAEALDVTGTTSGQIGTAWAWYLVAPNFAPLFSDPKQKPAEYDAPNTQKVVIIMTDGAYNTPYCQGVVAKNNTIPGGFGGGSSNYINCNATNGNPFTQAANLCTAMKAAGVRVITVGFEVGSDQTVVDTLTNCASSAGDAFLASGSAGLVSTFKKIGENISELRLAL